MKREHLLPGLPLLVVCGLVALPAVAQEAREPAEARGSTGPAFVRR